MRNLTFFQIQDSLFGYRGFHQKVFFPALFLENLDFPHFFLQILVSRAFCPIFTGWLLRVARGTRWDWAAWAGPDAPCPGWTAPPGRPGTRGIDSPRSPWTRTVSGQNGAPYIKKWKLCSKTEKHRSAAIGFIRLRPSNMAISWKNLFSFPLNKINMCFFNIRQCGKFGAVSHSKTSFCLH